MEEVRIWKDELALFFFSFHFLFSFSQESLWQNGVRFDTEGRVVDAIAAFSLLVLFHDGKSVEVDHFRDRLSSLIIGLDEPEFSSPKACLVLLADDEEDCDEEVATGMLQVFDGGGGRKLVCVGTLGFLVVNFAVPVCCNEDAKRFVFKPSGFAVVFDSAGTDFCQLFAAPKMVSFLNESSRVVQSMSQSFSEAILSGATKLSATIQPTELAPNRSASAPASLHQAEQAGRAGVHLCV
jgi:hypothetical protein